MSEKIKKPVNRSQFPRLFKIIVRVLLYLLAFITILVVAGVVFFLSTLYTTGPPQEGYLALTGATVLLGEDLTPRSDATVLIRNGTIVEVGDAVDIPDETETINLDGYTLMPGLIDLHVHIGSPELELGQQMGAAQMPGHILDIMRFFPGKRRAFLDHGVTTIRTLGDDYGWVMEFRQMLRDRELEGPRLFAAGPLFTTTGGHPVVTIRVETDSDEVPGSIHTG